MDNRRLILPGQAIDLKGPEPHEFDFIVDPDKNFAVVHKLTGSQVLFRADGTLGFRDAHGTVYNTSTDGALTISARRITFLTENGEQDDIQLVKRPATITPAGG